MIRFSTRTTTANETIYLRTVPYRLQVKKLTIRFLLALLVCSFLTFLLVFFFSFTSSVLAFVAIWSTLLLVSDALDEMDLCLTTIGVKADAKR